MPRKRRTENDDAQQEPARVITPETATDDDLDFLQTKKEAIATLRTKRASINAEIDKHRKDVKAKGFNLEGFDLGVKMADMDPAKRVVVDNTLALTRRALDVEPDLFSGEGSDAKAAGATAASTTH